MKYLCRVLNVRDLFIVIFLLSFILGSNTFSYSQGTVSFQEDWEVGFGDWYADNGLWEVGIPTAGPDSAHLGQQCIGTVMGGNYPTYANTRLISPEINLPSLSGDEKMLLKFWHWYIIEDVDDQGVLQISVNSGEWQTLSDPDFDGTNNTWSQYVADLSAYADSAIRIGFYFTSDNNYSYQGWYIDDVVIEKKVVELLNPEDFEIGIGDWNADNGLWEVGVPTAGPDSAHSGQQCVGTVLGGNYPTYANTRLISPMIKLPTLSGEEKILLKFWQWYIIEDVDDQGILQISVNSGEWQTISDPDFDGTNNAWSQYVTDLSAYADSAIRIGFYFTTDNNYSYQGWYIDDVSLEKKEVFFPIPEDFESGIGDWSADNGLWEVGIPIVGPDSTHSGQHCVGTVMGGNYPTYANTRLISPEIKLPTLSGGDKFLLKFWHWYIIEDVDDQGVLQISVNSGEWQTISDPDFDGTNNRWSQYVADLSAYADSAIRIGFYFTTDNNYSYQGWYIDDINIEGISGSTGISNEIENRSLKFQLDQNYPNPFQQITHIPFYIPEPAQVNILVFNSLGQEVAQVLNNAKPAGSHVVEFDGRNLPPGNYYFQMRVSDTRQVRKMLIIRE